MSDAAPRILLVGLSPSLRRQWRERLGTPPPRPCWVEAEQVAEQLAARPVALVVPLASLGGLAEPRASFLAGEACEQRVPVLLLTAEAPEAEHVLAAHPPGALDYLVWPPEPQALQARLAALVERHEGRLARDALRQSEERYRLATLATSDATYEWDMVTDELHWSRQVQTLFGFPPEEIEDIFTWWVHHIHREDHRRVVGGLRRAIARGDVKWRDEYRFARADGTYADVVDVGYILRGAKGRPLRMVGSMQDVTEQKRAERNLRLLAEASAQLTAHLEVDEPLRRLAALVVPRLADWCAVDLLDEDGQPRRQVLLHADARSRVRAVEPQGALATLPLGPHGLAHVVETGEPQWAARLDAEHVRQAANGDAAWRSELERLGLTSYLVVPLQSHGHVSGVLNLAQGHSGRHFDATDLLLAQELASRAALALDNARLYQRAQRAIALRDEFLSVAAHELRTPTASFTLGVQSLLKQLSGDGPLPSREQLRARVERLNQGAARLTTLEEQLLDVAQLAHGRFQVKHEPVDLVEAVRAVLERLAPQAARAGCALLLEEQGPVVGLWDRARVEEAVTHLLTNALKYGEGRPVRVHVRASPEWALLSVHDEGIGIPPEDQARIFGRFERAVSERHYGGLGLGLFITRQIVEALQGEVHVASRPGQGSTFFVVLPYSPLRARPPSPEQLSAWADFHPVH